MMSVCFKEKIKIAPDALSELIVGCNQDVRQVLHHLSMMKGRRDQDGKMDAAQAKKEAAMAKKTSIKVVRVVIESTLKQFYMSDNDCAISDFFQGPFDVVRKVFSATEQKGMSLIDKSDLFFQDYSMGPLFTQENYLSVVPKAAEKYVFERKNGSILQIFNPLYMIEFFQR